MNIAIVCGARPNFIKVAPIIRAIKNQSNINDKRSAINYNLIYTGVENDPTIEDSLFNDLEIDKPGIFLGADSENINILTGQVMGQFEEYLLKNPTDTVIVVDDLASTMATAIVTKKQGIKLAHIAAGTRSFDISMPKEINRLVIDGLSDILFTAGISNNSIANKEGAELSKVYMVGNILIDNLRYCQHRINSAEMPSDISNIIDNNSEKKHKYIVFTLNRKILIGDKTQLKNILSTVIDNAGDNEIIAPLRKNAKEAILNVAKENGFNMDKFHIVTPLGYLAFCNLMSHATGIISDSGNVVEEATFYQIPCITLNDYTEHIETVKVGTNILVGNDTDKLASALNDMTGNNWKKSSIPDRWDGRTAERILQILIA